MAAPQDASDNDKCGYRTVFDGTVFTLTIGRSFDPGVTFKLCQRKKPGQSFVLVAVDASDESNAKSETTLPLDENSYKALIKLYEAALDYNVKDDTMGLDGSGWCLETRRGFTYSKACFWTPGYETSKRGLIGLENLGNELGRLAKLEKTAGKLY
jgi:hypothetical protein